MPTVPAVSVILPAYNAEATIAAAVRSICTQTMADWELCIVDDGSGDGTPDVVAALTGAEPRIRLFRRSHAGLVDALTAGIEASRAPLIARMDADDIALPTRLAEQVQSLHDAPDVGLVGCLVDYGGDRVAGEGYARHVDWINSLTTPEAIALNRFVESPLAHPSVMFRRALVAEYGGYRDGNFPEDYELWLRWLDAGVKMAKVPRVLLRWNDPPSRLSRSHPRYDTERFFEAKAPWVARELTRIRRERAVWIWGAGRPTRKRAAALTRHGVRIAGYIDIDDKKSGRELAGVPVVSPRDLPSPAAAVVLAYVSSRGARDHIRAALVAAGYREGMDFLTCA